MCTWVIDDEASEVHIAFGSIGGPYQHAPGNGSINKGQGLSKVVECALTLRNHAVKGSRRTGRLAQIDTGSVLPVLSSGRARSPVGSAGPNPDIL